MQQIVPYFAILLMIVGFFEFMLAVFVVLDMKKYADDYGEKAVQHFLIGFWLLILPASLAIAGGPSKAVIFWCGAFGIPLYFHINRLYEAHKKGNEQPEPNSAPVAVTDDREKHQGGQSSGRPGAFDVPPQDN